MDCNVKEDIIIAREDDRLAHLHVKSTREKKEAEREAVFVSSHRLMEGLHAPTATDNRDASVPYAVVILDSWSLRANC